jgi:tRNA modification GTPase
MFCSDEDTIAAISTPLGEGGIGIVRLSGKDSVSIAQKIFTPAKQKNLNAFKTYRVVYGFTIDPLSGEAVDEVLVTCMKAPTSYTKEDVVEISCHGGMTPLRKTLELVLRSGARLAEPGEFTKRAFLNGRIDLSQAEAVLDLIQSKTDESRRIALEQLRGGLSEKITAMRDSLTEVCAHVEAHIDFPEDEIEPATYNQLRESLQAMKAGLGRLLSTYEEAKFFREGLSTAIVGRPNVGKSSLLNILLKKDRAIVTDVPGTTRDVIEEYLNINGLPLRIMDTAGIRHVEDIAEKEGVKRSLDTILQADLVIAIFDKSESLREEDYDVIKKTMNKNSVIVLNKCDLSSKLDIAVMHSLIPKESPILSISATRGDGLNELKAAIVDSCLKDWKEEREGIVISNIRHKTAIEHAADSLARAEHILMENKPLEFLALELRDALDRLGEIVGVVTKEDILNRIFSDFCIGK